MIRHPSTGTNMKFAKRSVEIEASNREHAAELAKTKFCESGKCEIWSQEAEMSRYVARFMKDVLGANGHETEICQRSLEIEAGNKTLAADLAKLRFCETENVKDWSLHADRVHVTDAEFSS
jgi:hypothetical protein